MFGLNYLFLMDVEYSEIMTGKYCCQFSLLTCNWFIGQFVHPVGEEGMGWKGNRYFSPLRV